LRSLPREQVFFIIFFAIDEGGGSVTAMLWTPTSMGAKLIYYLQNVENDEDGDPMKHIEIFQSVQTIHSGSPMVTKSTRKEALDNIAKVVPEITQASDIGPVSDMPSDDSPPAIPCIVEMCDNWC